MTLFILSSTTRVGSIVGARNDVDRTESDADCHRSVQPLWTYTACKQPREGDARTEHQHREHARCCSRTERESTHAPQIARCPQREQRQRYQRETTLKILWPFDETRGGFARCATVPENRQRSATSISLL